MEFTKSAVILGTIAYFWGYKTLILSMPAVVGALALFPYSIKGA